MAKSNSSDKRPMKQKEPKPRKPGKGGIYPPENGKKFSKEYQPPGEAKAAGIWKKKKGQELAKAVLELAFQGMKNSELKKAAAEYYGVEEKEITVEMMLVFRQAEKAIQKADTQAFTAVMDRAHGKPAQRTELTGKDGEKLFSKMTDEELEQEIKKYGANS